MCLQPLQLLTPDNEEASVEVVDKSRSPRESTTCTNETHFTTPVHGLQGRGREASKSPRASATTACPALRWSRSQRSSGHAGPHHPHQRRPARRPDHRKAPGQDHHPAAGQPDGGHRRPARRSEDPKPEREVPRLGSIPVLGWLFKSRNKKSTQTNLFIFITPKVMSETRPTPPTLPAKNSSYQPNECGP